MSTPTLLYQNENGCIVPLPTGDPGQILGILPNGTIGWVDRCFRYVAADSEGAYSYPATLVANTPTDIGTTLDATLCIPSDEISNYRVALVAEPASFNIVNNCGTECLVEVNTLYRFDGTGAFQSTTASHAAYTVGAGQTQTLWTGQIRLNPPTSPLAPGDCVRAEVKYQISVDGNFCGTIALDSRSMYLEGLLTCS